ncbi:helix-turn-helix transcriptional regulator [uncultured Vagococcus sp.]|uniref:helix-turn-helix domain-containing protein n=1 Tax=uncultured Vagococcus sp. TaxID=189676 RepID=UPI0028D71763|nr:helix-turn-helix transcriptional regulator [uncultured Vagococcus sp.]
MKQIRGLQKISQKKLAEKVGVSRTTIARYESQTSQADEETVAKIAVALNVSEFVISSDFVNGNDGQGATNSERSKSYLDKRLQIEESLLEQLEDLGIIEGHFVDLISDYMMLWDMKNDLIQDIRVRGVSIPWSNGDKQKGYKKNDSISEMHKTSTQMLKILDFLRIDTANFDGGGGDEDDDDF